MQLPLGLASVSSNNRYTAQSVGTRWGFKNRLKFGAQGSNITGLASLRYLANDNSGLELFNLLAYTATDGNLWSAIPYQQGSVTQLSTDALLALANLPRVTGLNPRITQAFNRGFIAMGDLASGRAAPMVYDPAQQTLDPASDKPFGVAWTPNTRLRVGQMVSPSSFQTFGLPTAAGTWVPTITGHLYRVVTAGITDPTTPPTWPTGTGVGVTSGTVDFIEYTPTCASGLPDPFAPTTPTPTPDGASPILGGATVFLVLTYVSAQGESINDLTNSQGVLDATKVLKFVNTTGGPIDLTVTMPPIPAELAAGGPLGANGATGYNAYAYIVQGTPNVTQYTDPTFYAQFGATNLAAGTTTTLSTWPTGQGLPSVNTATIATVGNVDTGIRWMVVMFETRTEYQTGFSISAPIQVNITQAGLAVLAQKIPVGPYNCIRRICAFTVAGASSAGPYTYVDSDDVESPGFNQPDIPITKTTIDDNVTTTATFNFTDTYLPGATDVTNYFQRIEIPFCSDVYFSKTLQQVIYAGAIGYPSGFLVSDLQDPEAVRVPGSNLQVSESDGDRAVCWREVRENQVAFKENSGFIVIPNDGDASTWDPQGQWRGKGPVGPKAVDVAGDNAANEFAVFAHRTGLYRWVGGEPQLVNIELIGTPEHPGLWDLINWTYGYLIIVTIDDKRREVRVSVPYGNSTVRNMVITVNYFFGWDDPVVFVSRRGVLVPNVNGRKWSLDNIACGDMIYVPQRYDPENELTGIDLQNALLVAGPDGALYSLVEGQYWDEDYNALKLGYLSKWQSVPGPNVALSLTSLEGASLSAIGSGFLNVYAQDDQGLIYPLSKPNRTWMLGPVESQRDFGAVACTASRFGIGFDNGGVAGAWYEMHTANLWTVPTFATRPG